MAQTKKPKTMKCKSCGKRLPLKSFGRKPTGKNGRKDTCTSCVRIRTHKHLLIPTKAQRKALEETLETHRLLYNSALEQRIFEYQKNNVTLSVGEQKKWLTSIYRSHPWLSKVNRNSLDATLNRLQLAYEAFFRRCKQEGTKAGFPRFKGKDFFNSFEYIRHGNGCKLSPLEEGRKKTRLYLQHIGNVKMWMDRPILPDSIKTVEIKREGKKWYACITQECAKVTPKGPKKPDVGLDVGLEKFLSTSDGEHVDNPRFLRTDLNKMRILQRTLSRRKKGSKRRQKAREEVGKLHRTIRNKRQHFLHEVTRDLVDRYGMIAVEKLTIPNMLRNKHLSLSISDAAWGEFVKMLTYKAADVGSEVVPVPPEYTSQICSECGAIVKKSLSTRTHRCLTCGYVEDRDVNAAKNILARAKKLKKKTRTKRRKTTKKKAAAI